MAAVLMTFAEAKYQLKIPLTDVADTDRDADIQLKLNQAEDIILRRLNNPRTSITSITAVNPAVVTTATLHGLTSGVTYTLSGTTTTPDVNGARVVTVISPTTFSVPVNVTSGQSEAAGIVSTPVWTSATVPGNVKAAIGLMLTHLFENRGDDQKTDEALWASINNMLVGIREPALA